MELDLLKLPWEIQSPVPKGKIAQRMFYAVSDLDVFVTPMAAVAGAVADEILDVMRETVEKSDYYLENVQRMYVNNGGDLSFWLKDGSSFSIGIIDNIETPPDDYTPNKIGEVSMEQIQNEREKAMK